MAKQHNGYLDKMEAEAKAHAEAGVQNKDIDKGW
jgi:hypothetical protein